MSKGTNIDKLVSGIRDTAKAQVKVQTCWVVAGQVDWEARTMTATGVSDDLDFFNISLGLGGLYRKPKKGTRCLIGMIENQEAASFLIDAAEVEEFSFTSGSTTLVMDGSGFEVSRQNESLKKILDSLIDEVLKIYAPMNKPGLLGIKQRLNTLLSS